MKKALIIMTAFTALLSGAGAAGDPLPIPPMPGEEVKKSLIYYKEGEVGLEDIAIAQRMLYWEAPSTLQFHYYRVGQADATRPQLTVTEERHNGTIATYNFYFKPGDNYSLQSFDKVVKDDKGRVVQREWRDLSHPVFDYPDDLTHVYTIEYCLRGLDMSKPGQELKFHIWLPPSGVVPMTARVKNVENITLHNGKSYTCRVVEIAPDMVGFLGPILGRLIRPFLATYNFWYETGGTHPTIRYVGPMGKVNTGGVPTEIYEMISIKQTDD